MIFLAEDEKLMRQGLEVLMEWCDEWTVEVNVEKSGAMHMRRKGGGGGGGEENCIYEGFLCWWQGERSGGGAQVPIQCSHMACVAGGLVNEYLANVRMV